MMRKSDDPSLQAVSLPCPINPYQCKRRDVQYTKPDSIDTKQAAHPGPFFKLPYESDTYIGTPATNSLPVSRNDVTTLV